MGDLIEITTIPHNKPVYYRITTGGLIFGIKSPSNSMVGLTTQPTGRTYDDFTIELSNGYMQIFFHKESRELVKSELREIPTINEHDYTTFWLQWSTAYVKFGILGETQTLLEVRPGLADLSLVSFSSSECPSHWKFELPPIRHINQLKYFEEGKPVWQKCEDHLPDNVIIGGFESSEPLYIVRAAHSGSLTPGKFVPSLGLGFISWGGSAHEKCDFEALCGYNVTWEKTSFSEIPRGAVVGGYSEVDKEPLFVGRAEIEGNLIPGKVQPSHRVCYVPFEDREVPFSHFEVLVVPNFARTHEIQVTREMKMEEFRLLDGELMLGVAIENLQY